jgi:hypothetical protein
MVKGHAISPHQTATAGPLSNYEIHPADKNTAPKEHIESVKSGEMAFYIYGRMEFRDIEDGTHWTTYCLRFDGKTFTKHPVFNMTDRYGMGEVKIDPPPK